MSTRLRTLVVWMALIGSFFAITAVLSAPDGEAMITPFIPLFLVLGVFLGLFVFLRRRAMGGQSIFALRNTTARLVPEMPGVGLADVAGYEDVKHALLDVADFLKNPKRWEASGARLPRGILLEGPPGCGKTLLARAVAGEAKVAFFEVSSSEFVELFVGVGAARVRDLFEQAAKKAPSVIFIDELDAIGRRRGAASSLTSHQEREQTLNQLLVCMDGFKARGRVVVIAATNRADVLDPALLRAGRFDVQYRLPALTRDERARALEIHAKGKSFANDVDLKSFAAHIDGYTGAEIEQLLNDAAMSAIRRTRTRGEQEVRITRAELRDAAQQRRESSSRFDKLDALFIESTSQLSQPTGRVVARVTTDANEVFEGDVVWVDAAFIKLRPDAGDGPILIPKAQVTKLQALAGTESSKSEDITADAWARLGPDAGG